MDEVNKPKHHTLDGIELFDILKSRLTPEELRGWCKGSIIKYYLRANHKGQHDTDIGKGQWYGNRLSELIEKPAPSVRGKR